VEIAAAAAAGNKVDVSRTRIIATVRASHANRAGNSASVLASAIIIRPDPLRPASYTKFKET
jgi:hypothetical protein